VRFVVQKFQDGRLDLAESGVLAYDVIKLEAGDALVGHQVNELIKHFIVLDEGVQDHSSLSSLHVSEVDLASLSDGNHGLDSLSVSLLVLSKLDEFVQLAVSADSDSHVVDEEAPFARKSGDVLVHVKPVEPLRDGHFLDFLIGFQHGPSVLTRVICAFIRFFHLVIAH